MVHLEIECVGPSRSLWVFVTPGTQSSCFTLSVLQTAGGSLDGEAPPVGVSEQVYILDVELQSGGDSTVQGSFVIQGLPEACVGARVLGR